MLKKIQIDLLMIRISMRATTANIAGALVILLSVFAPQASACTVPVFRYALERWENAPYRAIILRKDSYLKEEAQVVESLRESARGEQAPANLVFEEVDVKSDLSKKENAQIATWIKAHSVETFPFMLLVYPSQYDEFDVAWSGRLEPRLTETLTSSPARTEIARRLIAGDSAVWLLLEGSDEKKNRDAEIKLTALLTQLEKEIKLPEEDAGQGGPPVRLRSAIPLKIAFSILRIKRNDPAESHFVSMLIGTEKKAADATLPAAFPIFGRGRALTGIVGNDIAENIIRDASFFFSGPCSCQVKELNPGVDMLYAFNWDVALGDPPDEIEPAVVKPEAASSKPKLIDIPTATEKSDDRMTPKPGGESLALIVGLVLAGIVVIVSGIIVMRAAKK